MSTRVETELETLIRARYPIIYVVSWEEKRVESAIYRIAYERGKRPVKVWTATMGFMKQGGQRDTATLDPLAALDYIDSLPDAAIFLLKDFHRYITDDRITRRLRDLTPLLKNSFKTLILLSPILKLPAELEKEITVLDYGLPSYQDLESLLTDIVRDVKDKPGVKWDLPPDQREAVLKAAQGLTYMEAENVFSKSLVEKRTFDVDVILSEKEQIIRKSGILEYYPAQDSFATVGGLDLLKDWMDKRTASFTEKARDFGLPEPKGILLLGVQGCGKSLSAKAIGAQWKLPLLRLDVGKVFAGLVGASEENMRKALRVAESVAPCVAGDTRIALADGSEETIQALYESERTDLRVLGMTADWRIAPVNVRAVTRRPAPDLFTVRLRHGTLQATSNHLHPVLRDGALHWVRTDALSAGDHVAMPRCVRGRVDDAGLVPFRPADAPALPDWEPDIAGSLVLSVEPAPTPEFVYDLVCDEPHNFLANGIVTHNCILWLDELEKGLSGTQSSGSTDGGTTARVFSTFLTWLQEKTVPVFVVATANQVEALPPELLRKGRFDEIFFIDLPSKEEREEIFGIHLRKRKRDPAKFDLKKLAEATPGFSGAEIEQAVVEALYNAFDAQRADPKRDMATEDILQAVRATVPLSMTMREKIAYLRDWAQTRARDASSASPESIEEQTVAFLKARAEEEAYRRKAATVEKAAAAQVKAKPARGRRANGKQGDGRSGEGEG